MLIKLILFIFFYYSFLNKFESINFTKFINFTNKKNLTNNNNTIIVNNINKKKKNFFYELSNIEHIVLLLI
jgi:hypothetical protein